MILVALRSSARMCGGHAVLPENGGFSLELMVPEDREFSLEIGEGFR